MKDFKHPFIDKIEAIDNKLEKIIRKMEHLCPCDDILGLLNSKDIMELFSINSKTCDAWRREGLLPYVRIKGKIYYQINDIKKLIEQSKSNSHE